MWVEQTFPLRRAFLNALQATYEAAVFFVAFRQAPEAARQHINRWVAQQIHERIPTLLPAGSVTKATRLVLTNALYFKGHWAHEFSPSQTHAADFTRGDGTRVTIRLMAARINHVGYGERMPDGIFHTPVFQQDPDAAAQQSHPDGVQLLELPYRGDTLTLVVLLPRRFDGLATLEQHLSSQRLHTWLNALAVQKVHVFLPTFHLETTYQLAATLAALGMPAAFQAGGWTGISDSPAADQLAVSEVIHQALVEVNEQGTEAAAATATVVMPISARIERPIPVFRADHPFLFLIRDRKTNTILFMGRLLHPAA